MAIQAFFSETAPDIKFHPFAQSFFITYKVVSETAVEKVVLPLKNVTNQNLSQLTTGCSEHHAKYLGVISQEIL